MAEEFQPYFYLSHNDVKSPKPGKIIGFLLFVLFFVLLFLKIFAHFGVSWYGIGLVLGFAIISLLLGRIIHQEKKEEKESEPQTHEPKEPPQLIEEGHSL